MTRIEEENRVKQIAIGAGLLMLLAVLVCGALIGWRYLPGLLGEWIGTMIGVMTTPFFLETSFIIIGLTVVVAINHWRQTRDGEEFVYLERIEEADVPKGMPDQAQWAVYRDKPLEGEMPTLREQAEGALAIGDYDSAAQCIGAMPEEDLKLPEILALRWELAKASGKADLAAGLELELRNAGRKSI